MPTDQPFTLIFSPLTIRRKGRIGSFSFQVMRISSVLMRVFSCSFLNRFHVSSSLKCLKIFTVFSRFYENLAIFSERGVAVFANPSESKELVITPQYAHGQISSIHIAFTAITPASLYAHSKYRHSSLISPNPLLIAETLSNNVISGIIRQHPPFIPVVNDIPDIFSRILINRHNYIVAAS